MLLIIIKK